MNMIIRIFLEGLYRIAGCCFLAHRRRMNADAEPPPRPHLEAGCREMAADEAREAEAREWSEALIGDVADDPR